MIRSLAVISLAAGLSVFAAGCARSQSAWNFDTAKVGQVFNASSQSSCSGTLIGADLVLTAAHCVVPLGESTASEPRNISFSLPGGAEQVLTVSDIATHPNFMHEAQPTRDRVIVDIALLRLATSVPGSVEALTDRQPKEGTLAILGSGAAPDACPGAFEASGLIILDCEKPKGASGAPVYGLFEDGRKLLGVISANGVNGTDRITFATNPISHIEKLEWLSRPRARPVSY